MTRALTTTLWCGVLCSAVIGAAWGQSTGRLAGLVRDPSGLAVSGAVVSLYRPGSTNAAVQATTTSAGLFEFDALPPESYRVTVEKSGFATYEATDVRLSPGAETPLNVTLAAGQQLVSVNAGDSIPAVQTSNAEISTTLSTDQLDQLPILDRNPFTLVDTQAGVVGQSGVAFTTIDGLRTSLSNVTIDGINVQDNTVRYNGLDYVVNDLKLGQIQQFTLVTSNQTTIYGNGATQTAFVSPSGSNELHGSAFYLNKSNPMNANPWFQNASGLNSATKGNDGGFTVGGPLLKDKLFGYANYEFLRENNSFGTRATVLGSSLRSLLGITAAGVPILSNLLNQIPLPNVSGSDTGTYGLYQHQQSSDTTADNIIARLDFVMSPRSTIVASYLFSRLNNDDGASLYGSRAALVAHEKANLISGSWRFTPTGRVTNELRVGVNLAPIAFINREQTEPYYLDLDNLNFLNPVNSSGDQGRTLKTFDFQDNASYLFGRHNLQFGFQSQLVRVAGYLQNDSVPTVFLGPPSNNRNPFDGYYYEITQRFYPLNSSGVLGAAPDVFNLSLDNYAGYIQDTWKIRPNLSVSLGLRYDYYTPLSDSRGLYVPGLVNNNLVATFAASQTTYNLRTSGLYNTDAHNFGPNIGLAFAPFGNGKTAFRAAYGINYANDDFVESARYTEDFNVFAFNFNALGGGMIPSAFPSVPPPPGGTTVSEKGGPLAIIDPNIRTPYVQQWSAGVQQEISHFLLNLRYVGNHAAELWRIDTNTLRFLSASSGSTYNAFQIDAYRRLTAGLQVQANYTYSKALTDADSDTSISLDPYRDATDHRLDKGPAVFDIRHAFKTNFVYQMPFGRTSSGWLRQALGGWSLSALAVAQSGSPFSILSGTGSNPNQTADVAPGAYTNQAISFHQTANGPSIVAASAATGVFVTPAVNAPGALQPRSFYGPASVDLDLGIQKRFRFTERQNLEFRGVAVNVLNHPSFGFVDQYVSSSSFGQSAFVLYQPRTVQLSANFRF